jgi:hypothetical protein
MVAKACAYEWRTGKVAHRCPLAAGHGGKHLCSKPCLASRGEAEDAPAEPEAEDDVEPSLSDTHIPQPDGARAYGVVLALCGARQQSVLGTMRGCKFAPAPDVATCPLCRNHGGVR